MPPPDRVIAEAVERLVHGIDPSFWVPAVGNGQLSSLLLFLDRHALWPEVQAIVARNATPPFRRPVTAATARLGRR